MHGTQEVITPRVPLPLCVRECVLRFVCVNINTYIYIYVCALLRVRNYFYAYICVFCSVKSHASLCAIAFWHTCVCVLCCCESQLLVCRDLCM